MTVIVQQPTDSNGNPQPMVYDSDTGKIIVDSDGYYVNGGKRLFNIPTKADYVSTPKTSTSGIQEAIYYAIGSSPALLAGQDSHGVSIHLTAGQFPITKKIYMDNPNRNFNGSIAIIGAESSDMGNITQILVQFSDDYVIEGPAQASFQNQDLKNLAFGTTSSYTQYGVMHWASTNDGNALLYQNIISGLNLASGYTILSISNCQLVVMDYVQSYDSFNGSPTTGISATNVLASKIYNGFYQVKTATYVKWEGAVQETVVDHRIGLSKVQNAVLSGISELILSGNNGSIILKNMQQGNNIGSAIIQTNVADSTTITINSIVLKDTYLVERNIFGTYNGTTGNTVDINQMIFHNVVVSNTSTKAFNGNNTSITVSVTNFKNEFYNLLTPSYPISGLPYNAPTISTNPPVSGTVYQNTNLYDIRLKIPITYNPSTSAAATLATGISSTSTVTTSTKVSLPSGLTAADGQILTYDMVVPAGWYYELVATNATIGTAEIEAA